MREDKAKWSIYPPSAYIYPFVLKRKKCFGHLSIHYNSDIVHLAHNHSFWDQNWKLISVKSRMLERIGLFRQFSTKFTNANHIKTYSSGPRNCETKSMFKYFLFSMNRSKNAWHMYNLLNTNLLEINNEKIKYYIFVFTCKQPTLII